MIDIDFLKKGNRTKYAQSDIGTSNLFIDSFRDELLYCADIDTWYVWSGKNWEIDCMLMRYQFIKQLAFYCNQYIFTNASSEKQSTLLKYYGKLTDKNFRDRILKDSMSIKPVKSNSFNRFKFLFNCQNGTYDFNKNTFKNHDRTDLLTDISNVTYDASARCDLFNKYLDEVMENKEDKIDYLMKIASYCLTGDTSRECFFVLYGDKTRNGKGTFVSTIANLAGSYSNTLRAAAITRKQINSGASNATPEIAKLISSRMVNINELEDGMMLDISLIKTLTGGDTMTARKLYKDEVEFVPQFKLLINTNTLPRMTDDSIFKSDRIHILCFDRHFERIERDLHLKDKLKLETSGIFNLLVYYYGQLNKSGFIIPKDSQEVVDKYHLNSNNVMQFVADNMNKDTRSYEKTSVVYRSYQNWCEENGYHPLGKKTFKERMERLDFFFTDKEYHKTNEGLGETTYWAKGYSLTPINAVNGVLSEVKGKLDF